MKIYCWNELSEEEKAAVLARPDPDAQENIRSMTQGIIANVKMNGDSALRELTEKYDGVDLKALQVTAAEFDAANDLKDSVGEAISYAKKRIEDYHRLQLPVTQTIQNSEGIFCERQPRPIARVGLYIPGGSAPLISTVLMLAIPAQLAHCPLRILCTPADSNGRINPYLLGTAKLCGIEKVYKIGGAQAIAAMAYGTETVPKVDKIFGPGNAWVTQAKIEVAQDPAGAGIDMPAGPSEIMIIADDDSNPEYVATDLLSQAEHGIDSQVMLIAFSKQTAARIQNALQAQLQDLSRIDIIKKSLLHGRIIIAEDITQAFVIGNHYAPEHLILHMENAEAHMSKIQNAGAVFLGCWTPETIGDYVMGSNHVLPTHGYARCNGGLAVTDFMKYVSFQKLTKEALFNMGPHAEKLAETEGLTAHAHAVKIRLKPERSQ